jgi:hypothetical protein
MVRLEDKDPGPPLTILVSANRAGPDSTYKVTGFVRNDSSENYRAVGVNATFFDDQGFRHGPLDAHTSFLILRPGEQSPFSVTIPARRVESFLLHPEGEATGHESADVSLSQVWLTRDGLESVRIRGIATNPNPFKIKNVAVAGALHDASGQLVSLGTTYILQEDIEPGHSVPFDVRVKTQPYTSYRLYAQAERDWE